MKIFNNSVTYTLDDKSAEAALKNIFESSGRQPNTVPFDKLLLRRKINTALYMAGVTLSVILFVLVLIVPFLFH